MKLIALKNLKPGMLLTDITGKKTATVLSIEQNKNWSIVHIRPGSTIQGNSNFQVRVVGTVKKNPPRPAKLSAIKKRLQYLRGKINKENISYGEIAELHGLARYIDRNDTLLLEWAGVPEKRNPVGMVRAQGFKFMGVPIILKQRKGTGRFHEVEIYIKRIYQGTHIGTMQDALNEARRIIKNGQARGPRKNPVLIYPNIDSIHATKTGRVFGGRYKHKFDSPASVLGLKDGSLKVVSKTGKRLWGTYQYDKNGKGKLITPLTAGKRRPRRKS
jgi:hypothetical protein